MSPHRILGMITLEEAFSRRNINVSHFRIFRASFSFHVSEESNKKLELTAKLGVFVGYTETPHNYWGLVSFTKDESHEERCQI